MKTTFLNAVLAMVLMAAGSLAGCGGSIDLAELGTSEDGIGQGPVNLFYVTASTEVGYGDPVARGKIKGFIEVGNLAYHKEVVVHYTTRQSGIWKDLPATYLTSLPNNREVWSFESEGEPYSPRLSADFQFAIRYSVAGAEYWDNNGGNDYRISTGPRPTYPTDAVLGKNAIALSTAFANYGGNGNFHGELVVRNLAYQKNIDIVYTTDGWKTSRWASAFYMHPKTADTELWAFDLPTGGNGNNPPIEFAVRYRAAGAEIWDNHFGLNYQYQ